MTISTTGLQTIAQRERMLLAPYAMHSADSRGRKHEEPKHAYRGPFQRDRDRILHSAAYRRLSGKMQVFTGDMGDYHRTRLTHTQEVASIARTMGRALRLNEDLIEALALFHDIGHPPFGHAGEDALNECLADHGGFSHNQYALTIAEQLETRYHEFPGLNLTHEVLDSQATRVDKQRADHQPLLEAQVVDAADSITYDAHDVDDAIVLGLVTLQDLAQIPLIGETLEHVRSRSGKVDLETQRKAVVHDLIDRQVGEVLSQTGDEFARHEFPSADEARESDLRVGPSEAMSAKKTELEAFLYQRVYRHAKLAEVREQAQRRLRLLFEFFVEQPFQLPARFQQRAEVIGAPRAVGDYLAGMTDRYCNQQFSAIDSRKA